MISAGAIIQSKYRVCWGRHQTCNDTNYRIETLYTRDVARETRPTAHRSHGRQHDFVPQRFTLVASLVDGLSSHRRKWDILRITLAITFYTSTPWKSLKRENSHQQLSPTDFVHPQLLSPLAGSVPPQVIQHIVASALKFDVVTLAREFIEDWLTKRGQDASMEATTVYVRIIEVNSLHILTRLGAWEDAREFMRYKEELREEVKQVRIDPTGFHSN